MNISSFLSPVDLSIVVFFMLATLMLGLRAGRGVKTVRDYAIANQSYSAPILFMTLTATLIGGGSTAGVVAAIYQNGVIFIFAMLGLAISILLARIIVRQFDERFDGMISAGDIIRAAYGKSVEKFSSIVVCIYSLAIITAQIVALGHLVHALVGWDYKFSVCVMGIIMTTYSTFGGIRAVTITDVLQFAVLVVTIPILAQIVLSDAGSFATVFSKAKEIAPQKLQFFSRSDFWDYTALFILWLMPISLEPVVVQRFLMAKNKKQLGKLFYGYAFLVLCLLFITTCIAFSAIVLLDTIEPKEIIPTFVSNYLPIGLKGLVIAGMIAAIMSTADSFLNTSGIFFAHNLIHKKYNKLSYIRWFTLVVGVTATLMSLFDANIINIIIVANSLILLAVVLPTVMVILRFKVTPSSYWIPICIALPIFILGQFVFDYGFKAQLVSIVIASVLSLLMVMMQNGWKNYLIPNESCVLQSNQFKWHKLLQSWKHKIDESIQSISIPFAIFALTAFTLPYFMWSSTHEHHVLFRVIAGFLCIGLLLRDYYPKPLKKYYPILWIITIIYCLPFMTTVVVLVEGDNLWLINLALSIFLLAAIADWVTFVVIATTGVLIGLLYVVTFGGINLLWDQSATYSMIYTVIFSTLIGLIFNRTRERKNEDKLDTRVLFAQAMAHELKSPISAATMSLGVVQSIINSASHDSGEVKIKSKEFEELARFLKNADNSLKVSVHDIDMLLTAATAESNNVDVYECKISKVIQDVKSDIKSVYFGYVDRINFTIKEDFKFIGSEKMMQHVLLNLIDNSIRYGLSFMKDAVINIQVDKDRIVIEDTGHGVPSDMQKKLFTKGVSTKGTGLGLTFCKKIMESMGGSIEYRSVKDGGAKFVLKFPALDE